MATTAKYSIKVNDKEHEVESEGQNGRGTLNGEAFELDLQGSAEEGFHIIRNNKSHNVQVLAADYETKQFTLRVGQNEYTLEARDRFDLLLKQLGMEHLAGAAINDLKAPMPGMVLDIKIKAGDTITKGQALVVLEAMKMENVLKAEADATVKAVNCQTGSAVEKNQVLVEFEA